MALGNRIHTLKTLLPPIENKISELFVPDRLRLERLEWHNDVAPESSLFTKDSGDKFVRSAYPACHAAPALEVFDAMRTDGINTLEVRLL